MTFRIGSNYPAQYAYTNKTSAKAQEPVTTKKEDTKKEGMSTAAKVAIGTTVGIGVAALVDAIFFKGKYSKKVISFFKNLFSKPKTTAPTKPTTGATTTGVSSGVSTSIKTPNNTSPISNAQEASVVNNINTQYVNGNTRRLVEKASRDVVTPQQQAAYDRAIAYQAPTSQQQAAIDKLHAANATQRAELNSIANNSKGAEKLQQVAQKATTEGQALANLGTNTIKHANGNIYHIQNGKVVKVDLYQKCADGTLKFNHSLDGELKIAKHLSKQNVTFA